MDDKCFKAVFEAGFHVDKEELAKALKYDRDQYDKGYADGYAEGKKAAAREIWKKLQEDVGESVSLVRELVMKNKKSAKDIAFEHERIELRKDRNKYREMFLSEQSRRIEEKRRADAAEAKVEQLQDWVDRLLRFTDLTEDDMKKLIEK